MSFELRNNDRVIDLNKDSKISLVTKTNSGSEHTDLVVMSWEDLVESFGDEASATRQWALGYLIPRKELQRND